MMTEPHNKTMRPQKGFTLIEVIIVVVIVAILASVAIPAYFDQVTRSKRTDATIALTNTAQQLERCFTTANTYAGCFAAPPATFASPEGEYNITVATPNATSYTLTATAIGTQANDDDCDTFTLDQTGLQGATGNDSNNCW